MAIGYVKEHDSPISESLLDKNMKGMKHMAKTTNSKEIKYVGMSTETISDPAIIPTVNQLKEVYLKIDAFNDKIEGMVKLLDDKETKLQADISVLVDAYKNKNWFKRLFAKKDYEKQVAELSSELHAIQDINSAFKCIR